MSADLKPPGATWAAVVFALTGLNFVRLLPVVLGFVFVVVADAGWALGTDAAWVGHGLTPAKDFAYFYGLLTLVIDRGWFALFGRSPAAVAALIAACNLAVAAGLVLFGRGVGIGRVGRVLLAVAAPIAVMPLGYPSPAHALEAALLSLALGLQAGGRPAVSLVLCVLAVFVKPALGFVYGPLLVGVILTAPGSWSARLGRLLPAAITTVVVAGLLAAVFGGGPLFETIVPLSAAKVYAADRYGFFFGTGRRFWLPVPFHPLYYVLSPVGFWLAASAVLVIGGGLQIRRWRDRRAAAVLTCLVLHAVFVLFLFGNQFSWLYYAFLPVCGAAGVVAGWEHVEPRRSWRLAAGAALGVLALLGQYAPVVEAARVWAVAVRSDATGGLYALPEDAAAMAEIRELARAHRVLMLTRSGGPSIVFPELESPHAWYLLRPVALPAEVERVREQIRAAEYLVIPTAPDGSLSAWPEFYDEFAAFRQERRYPSFLVVKRVAPPR